MTASLRQRSRILITMTGRVGIQSKHGWRTCVRLSRSIYSKRTRTPSKHKGRNRPTTATDGSKAITIPLQPREYPYLSTDGRPGYILPRPSPGNQFRPSIIDGRNTKLSPGSHIDYTMLRGLNVLCFKSIPSLYNNLLSIVKCPSTSHRAFACLCLCVCLCLCAVFSCHEDHRSGVSG
jgi:hypothetical protein